MTALKRSLAREASGSKHTAPKTISYSVKTSVALKAAAAGTTTRRSSTRSPVVGRSRRAVSGSDITLNFAAARYSLRPAGSD